MNTADCTKPATQTADSNDSDTNKDNQPQLLCDYFAVSQSGRDDIICSVYLYTTLSNKQRVELSWEVCHGHRATIDTKLMCL